MANSKKDDAAENKDDDKASAGDSSASALAVTEVGSKLEPILKGLPKEKQEAIRHTIQETYRETFMGIAALSGPKIDAETARILADSQDKEGQRRFEYLQAKQQNQAEDRKRIHALAETRHRHNYKLVWPIEIIALLIVVGCVASGIYLAATGRDILGASILTGIFAALLGYLGGLGTSNFFKR